MDDLTPEHAMPRFTPVIAVVGNPTRPPAFTEEHLHALRAKGFDTVQLNIAWLSRPHDEPLNLRDVVRDEGEAEPPRVAERRAELARRSALARRLGFRTMFHIGSPFMWRDPATGEVRTPEGPDDTYYSDLEGEASRRFDVADPRVAGHELHLLARLRAACPDIDDLLVYTYDQDAWQASEFGPSPFSRGVPLHERLPAYLARLTDVWTRDRPGSTLWWEPWELSAGQVLACVPHLPATSFGLCLHSNIAEVQIARPVDTWLRNTARAAARRGIPIVAEAFLGANNEEIEPCALSTVRLVDEQLRALSGVEGVTGVKEYFGVDAQTTDLNLDLAAARLADPDAPFAALLAGVLDRNGLPAEVTAVLDRLDEAVQLIPWDTSWFLRKLGTGTPDHGWHAAIIRGRVCTTPSWESSRRGHFMKTDDDSPHVYLLEDVQLRCALAADAFAESVALLDHLPAGGGPAVERFATQTRDAAERLGRIVRGFALHLRETLVVRTLRGDRDSGRPLTPRLCAELIDLLRADVANTSGAPEPVAALHLAETDLDAFLDTYLLPASESRRELGLHAFTTA
ncbi:hypothetical protein [Phytohabitans kaempferiae]|uniref:Uncharacterized protein n=1 Tax=Phytohabitans kaempferiae TaxID=1620943 RepID=A0ABV6M3Q6_9ACTN